MDVAAYMAELGQQARAASREVARSATSVRNQALLATAEALNAARQTLADANRKDLENGRANGLDEAMLDRLELTPDRIDTMIEGLKQVATLPDPVGEITDMTYRPSGIQVGKMRVPLGVIGIIYESRPNVTVEAASLCLKSGNATILRGGSEAIHSNQAIAECLATGLAAAGLPETAVQVVKTTDRAAVGELITMPQYVDVIVPRGGKGLIERISRDARVPVIKHLDGVCHVYIDSHADPEKALKVAVTPRPTVTAPATPWKPCWWTRKWQTICCPCWRPNLPQRVWNCGVVSVPVRFLKASVPPPRTTGTKSTWRRFLRCVWSTAWMVPSNTSTGTAPSILTASSPRTTPGPAGS